MQVKIKERKNAKQILVNPVAQLFIVDISVAELYNI